MHIPGTKDSLLVLLCLEVNFAQAHSFSPEFPAIKDGFCNFVISVFRAYHLAC